MPAFVAAAFVASAVATGVGVAVGTVAASAAVGFFLTSFATATVLGGLSRALTKKPGLGDQSSFGAGPASAGNVHSSGRMVSVRQPLAPWQVIIGEARVGGDLTFCHLSGDKRYFHQVVTFAGHACREFTDLMLNDEITSLDAAGNVVDGSFYLNGEIPASKRFTCPGTPFAVTLDHTVNTTYAVTQHIGEYKQIAGSKSDTVPASPFQITLDHTPSRIESVTQTVGSDQVPVELGLWAWTPGTAIVTFTADGVGADVTINYFYDGEEVAGQDFHVPSSLYTVSGNTITFGVDSVGADVTINYGYLGERSYIRVKASLGDEGTAQPFPDLVVESDGKWSSEHLQAGKTKLWIRYDLSNAQIFPGGLPNVTAIFKGKTWYDPRTAAAAWTHNPALAISGYITDQTFGLKAVYADEIHEDSLTAAANECEERVRVNTATATFTASASTDKVSIAAGANGGKRLPLTGDGVRVSTTGSLPGGLAAATTYYAIRASGGTIKLASSYANAMALTAIDITDAGTGVHTLTYWDEPRYAANGSFRLTEQKKNVILRLKDAMAGKAVNVGGQWHIHAGGYEAPTVTLTASDIAGPIEILPMVDVAQSANAVRGIFTDPNGNWQPDDFPPLTSATFLTEDNDVRQWRDIDLSAFTASATMAQRLAKIDLQRLRNNVTYVPPCKLSAFRALTARTVAWTFDRYGWTGQAFELDASEFYVDGEGRLGVNHVARMTGAAVYEWDETAEEQTFGAVQATTLPSPTTRPAAPGQPFATEEVYAPTGAAFARSRVTVIGAASQGPYVREHALEWKAVNEASYRRMASSGAPDVMLDDLPAGLYLMRWIAISERGLESIPSATVVFEAKALTAAPSDVEDFNLLALPNNMCKLTWRQHPDADVRLGGTIDIRYSPLTTAPGWNDCQQLISVPAGGTSSDPVPHRTGTYRARAVDSGGRQSPSSVYVLTTEPDLLAFNAVETFTAEPDWDGTKSHVCVRDGQLRLGSGLKISEMTDPMSEWGQILTLGGVAPEGEIEFDEIIDLGAVYTSRLTAAVETLSFSTSDKVSKWLEPMSQWGKLSGPEITTTSCEIFVSTTDDDPNGATPGWSTWRPFVVGDYKARGLKFRVRLRSANTEHNIEVESLEITIDMPDRDQALDFSTSAAGDTAVTRTLSPAFKTTPKLGVTMKNMATGDYLVITSETAAGFTANTYNAAAARVARNGTARGKAY